MLFKPASSSSKLPSPVAGQPGQIAVVVLLVMAVMLVVVYSLATRTTEEIQLSGQEQDSTRVFNAAESGVEQALSESKNYFDQVDNNGSASFPVDTTTLPANTTANVSITRQSGLTNTIPEGGSATVFVDTGTTSIQIHWVKTGETCANRAALILATYYDSNKVSYEAIKPSCSPWDPSNTGKGTGFSTTGVTEGNYSFDAGIFKQRYTLTVPATTTMVRVKALYAPTDINIAGIAGQAYEIKSEAASGVSGETFNERSAIKVIRTRPAPPQVLDYSVYSGGSLAK